MKIKDVIKEEVNDFILNEVENELGKMINETTYKVYHGTNEKFNTFDPNKTADGTIWFTDNVDSIKNGEHGGDGNKFIMTRHITLNNPAGWDEYEKYSIGELEDMGYDGVILSQDDYNNFIVFSTKSISSRPNGLGESIDTEVEYNGNQDDSSPVLPNFGDRLNLKEDKKIGININDDTQPFSQQILNGEKTIETRNTPTLRPYVGKRVGIVSTGKNKKAMLVGFVNIDDEFEYNNEEAFDNDVDNHLVTSDSPFYIKDIKYGYHLSNPEKISPVPIESRGIVSRKIN